MVRPKSKNKEMDVNDDQRTRQRLKNAAFSSKMLSGTQSSQSLALNPSKTLLKHHGTDILRKSQRKNRFLFSFPALLAPIAGAGGGKIGELKDLSTKNPILYLQFPQGQIKLFGTVVYPKNRYLTLQFSKAGKNVLCEDYFDNIIAFSDAWWIGTKEENPAEARLPFPTHLTQQAQDPQFDFKGGAGSEPVANNQFVPKTIGAQYSEDDSPETEFGNDSPVSYDKNNLKESTPIRHSARMAGKTFKFADASSGDDSVESNRDDSGEDEKNVKNNISSAVVMDIDNDSDIQPSAIEATKSEALTESTISLASNETSRGNHGSLVQSTIATLFKKVHEKQRSGNKTEATNSRRTLPSEDSGQKLPQTDLKTKVHQVGSPRKKVKRTKAEKSGTGTKGKKKVYEVEDDIEELSSSSQDTNGSDENWSGSE